MDETPSVDQTIDFLKVVHKGQRYGDMPYDQHPVRALRYLEGDHDIEVELALLLHDVLEKSKFTADDLRKMGYTDRTVLAVELVTKRDGVGVYKEGMSYVEWIKAIINTGNIGALRVKYADLAMNSDPENLKKLPPEKADELRDKYKMPMVLLRDAMEKNHLLPLRGRHLGEDDPK
ncbi:MAG: hypothetical protein WDN72_05915 [Alphaproteobacteria bacterium]